MIKLKRLINQITNENKDKLEFKIINADNEDLNLGKDVDVELLSKFALKIERDEFERMVKKYREETKNNLKQLNYNLKKLKIFYINQVFLIKLIEYDFIEFFRKLFGEYEIIQKILQIEKYDKAILFNYNPNFSKFASFLRNKYKKLELYQDSLLKFVNKNLKYYFFTYLVFLAIESMKGIFSKKYYKKSSNKKKDKKNIILYGYKPQKKQLSPSQSLKPIYDGLKKDKNLNPLYFYTPKEKIPLSRINKIIGSLFQMKKLWYKYLDKISMNMEYNSIKLNQALREFFNFLVKYQIVGSYEALSRFKNFIEEYPPSLLISCDRGGARINTILKNCKIYDIPSIFVPVAANPVEIERITLYDFTYLIATGEKTLDYFVSKGEPRDKIVVTGRPRYQFFYKGQINKLTEVKDMFDNRIYKFEPNKFTILLGSNIKVNKSVSTSLINSLKELNLIDNLIIKLHPREDAKTKKRMMQDLGVNPIIVRDYNIFEIIKSCDLFLSVKSTTILESMIVGTPTIILDFINQPLNIHGYQILQFLEEDLILKIRDAKKLTEILDKLVNDKNFYTKYAQALKKLASQYSFYDDLEDPISKIRNLILKLLTKS